MKKARKQAKDVITDSDMFGHIITFNFNNQGETYKTFLGGSVSIFVRLLVTVFVVINVKKMILKEDDKLISVNSMRNVDEKPVYFRDMHILPFISIRKQIGPKTEFDESIYEHINFSYKH